MKVLMHPVAVAFGLAVLACLGLIAPLIDPAHRWIYHDSGPASAVFLPVLINVVMVWLVLALLLLCARRPDRVRVFVWSALIVIAPWLIVEDGALLGAWVLPVRVGPLLLLASCLAWGVFVVLLRDSFAPAFERVCHFANTLFAFSALSGLLVAGQLVWCFWQARALETTLRRPAPAVEPAGFHSPKPRIVWIVLDELSYQQLYERRFPGLALPAFDQLAAESTVFTDVLPAAMYTEVAIPSLMTGITADSIRSDARGVLMELHEAPSGKWRLFQEGETVFQDAVDHGYATAIAGWYNPYCRLLPSVTSCQWTFRPNVDRGMFGESTILANTLAPWYRLASYIEQPRHGKPQAAERIAQEQIADYRGLLAVSDRMLADSSLDFLLLHIPVPHPGGIYDRSTGEFRSHGASYIDNLALADRYLAHVRQRLEASGQWDSTTLLVMGDHSWRTTLMWKDSPTWTPEDQLASLGGRFDPRPAYLVKLPYQREPARIDNAFAATRTRALLQELLAHRIQTPDDLATFAALPARN